jgi:glycosyltransferase involved in cell wall biosynthesis
MGGGPGSPDDRTDAGPSATACGRRATDAGPAAPRPRGKGDAKVVVVMPARNAARTLERTVSAIPRDWVDEIILVDDSSTDDTVALARTLPLQVIWHPHNVGYGGNQKTCYLQALQQDADVVVMLHPDGQYEPTLIPELVKPIIAGTADLVLGSRLAERGSALRGGMPKYKFVANRTLTTIENHVLGTSLSELHTGYRAYSRALLMGIPFLRNALDFSFDSEVLMQAAHFGFRIEEVPARTLYFDDASSIGPRAATIYGLKTLGAAGRLILHRRGIWRSRRFEP